ncbi:MAG: ABC transporter substrate-binding protein [Coriobacteriaceae bacterium]|nr:ABC transporter substrate-binding protein [Coriobacteriaceae bacterium]
MIKAKNNKVVIAALVAVIGAVLAFGLVGCGGGSSSASASAAASGSASQSSASDSKTITVAAVPTPHAEVLNDVVAPLLKAEGYELVVKEFSDYVLPNTVTEEGEADANYFQHKPYLDDFNKEQGTHLVSVTAVHYEPFGLYAGKDKSLKSLDALADGASVAVPNDPTNEARALLLLEQAGLIKLADGSKITATKADIVENPKNLNIIELEAAQTAHSLADVDIAAINSNYALEAGLNVSKDAIVTESADSEAAQTYANLLVVKKGNENSDAIKALAKALNSSEVRDYINKTYEGAVLPIF